MSHHEMEHREPQYLGDGLWGVVTENPLIPDNIDVPKGSLLLSAGLALAAYRRATPERRKEFRKELIKKVVGKVK